MNFTHRGMNRGFGGGFNGGQGRTGSYPMQQQNGNRGNFTGQQSRMPFNHSHSSVIPAITTILVWTFLIFAIIALAKHIFANGFPIKKPCCSAPKAVEIKAAETELEKK